MTKDIKLNIVNAHELDPKKKYIIELDGRAYTLENAHRLAMILEDMGAKATIVINNTDRNSGVDVKEVI